MWTRRAFLKGGALAALSCGWGGLPSFLTRSALARDENRPKTLVTIFQRGAMDGLMAVQPLGNPNLEKVRPQLLLPHRGNNSLLSLNDAFGLHPSFEALRPFFLDKRLAIVHGVGSPNSTRSHFDAQDYMETGIPDRKGAPTGWLNRASGLLGHEATPFQSVAFTGSTPKSMYGEEQNLCISSLEDFQFKTGSQESQKKLESLYQKATQSALNRRGTEAFEAADVLSAKHFRAYKPRRGVRYPRSPLGRSLRQIAFLIKSGVGLEIAFAESNGWDTHRNQGTRRGPFARRARDLAESIAAFWEDLEQHQEDVAVMTMTEFGRTVAQNGSRGTDHGRASCMFCLGQEVKGGEVFGKVGSLAKEDLADGRDLPVSTDFRDFFAGVAGQHLGIPIHQGLFPRWQGQALKILRT